MPHIRIISTISLAFAQPDRAPRASSPHQSQKPTPEGSDSDDADEKCLRPDTVENASEAEHDNERSFASASLRCRNLLTVIAYLQPDIVSGPPRCSVENPKKVIRITAGTSPV